MAKNSWFRITGPQAKAAGDNGRSVARIDIFGEIGWEVTASDFLRELRAVGDVDVIDLRIQSAGGSVLEGWAVANALKHHPAKVSARVEGMAASMASVIACAADTVAMPTNAYMMIHNVTSFAIGGSDELRSQADLIDKLGNDIAAFYAARTGKDIDEIQALMDATTWMNGDEAVAAGFADMVLEEVSAAAVLTRAGNLDRYTGQPAALLENISADPEPEHAPEEPAAEPEEAPEETPEPEPAGEPVGFLTRIIDRLSNGPRQPAAPEPSALAAADARALSAEARATEAEAKVHGLTAQVRAMEAEAKKVWELCSEAGFAPAAAGELPPPDGSEEGGIPGANVRERFNAITDKDERRAFYEKHKAELLK